MPKNVEIMPFVLWGISNELLFLWNLLRLW